MPEYEEIENFVATASTTPRDDRHITVTREVSRHRFWFFTWKTYGLKIYRDSTGADFDYIGNDCYRHRRLGINYTRDRQKYG